MKDLAVCLEIVSGRVNGHISAKNGTLAIDREKITDLTSLRNICPSQSFDRYRTRDEYQSDNRWNWERYSVLSDERRRCDLSGGEPFSQDPALKELITELKARGLNISVETSLHVPWETIEDYLDMIDVFLADLKHLDEEKFTKYTGGNATLVMNNFRKLDEHGKTFIVRVLLFPGSIFLSRKLFAIIDFAAGLINAHEIDLFRFIRLPGKNMQCWVKSISLKITGMLKKLN